jgi:hypothetical protein
MLKLTRRENNWEQNYCKSWSGGESWIKKLRMKKRENDKYRKWESTKKKIHGGKKSMRKSTRKMRERATERKSEWERKWKRERRKHERDGTKNKTWERDLEDG